MGDPVSIEGEIMKLAGSMHFASPEEVAEAQRERAIASAYQTRREALAPLRGRLPQSAYDAILADALERTTHLAAVQSWVFARPAKPFLILSGPVGCGKTLAGAWAISDMGGEMVDASRLAQRVSPWVSEVKQGAEPLSIETTPMVVVDDLGTERVDDRFREALFEVVNRRQGSCSRGPLRTLFTTNLSAQVLRARYPDDRLWSRLDSMGVVIVRDGVDRRAV